MLKSLDHVVLVVEDLDEAARDYEALLGRPPSWKGLHEGGGTSNVLFRLENTKLELLSPTGNGAFADWARGCLARSGPGLHALAFETDDVVTAVESLRASGWEVAGPLSGRGLSESGDWREWQAGLVPPTETGGVDLLIVRYESGPELVPETEPKGDPGGCVHALDHVVLRTRDPDRAIEVYRDRLKLRLALDRPFDERGLRLLFFRIGGATLEVAAGLGPDGSRSPDDLWGVAWRVADVEAAKRRIAEAGFHVSEVRDGVKPGTRVATVRDRTHGAATLLIEAAPRPA